MAAPTKWTFASDPLLDISMYNEAGNGAGNMRIVTTEVSVFSHGNNLLSKRLNMNQTMLTDLLLHCSLP